MIIIIRLIIVIRVIVIVIQFEKVVPKFTEIGSLLHRMHNVK